MSEAKDFRPRLNAKELQFLIDAVKRKLTVLDLKKKEYKALESKVDQLRLEWRNTNLTHIFQEWKRTQEEFKAAYGNKFAFQSKLLHRQNMCNRMIRRLEKILDGGKPHRHWAYHYDLDRVSS